MNAEKEEKLVRELMGKSGSEMPFVDFENKLMEQIHKEENASRSFLKDVKLSSVCFSVFW